MARRVRFYGRSRIRERQDVLEAVIGALLLLAPIALYEGCARVAPGLPIWIYWLPPVLLFAGSAVLTRIYVGDDGVSVAWFGWRFIPYGEVSYAVADGRDVVLVLKSGTRVLLPIGAQRKLPTATDMRRDKLLFAIDERLAAARRRAGAFDVEALVSRRGRDTQSWAGDLRVLTEGTPFRTAIAEPERLWQVLEDAAAAVDARMGAAVALMTDANAESRARIRAIADAAAAPRVRVALKRVAAATTTESASIARVLDEFAGSEFIADAERR